ncbi:MAG: hypothetical protein QW128_04245 [Thermoprotei archaeon]
MSLSYMLGDGVGLTQPITPSEASFPKPCRLSGEFVEIGETPDFSREESQN